MAKQNSSGMSYETKNIIVVLLLLFVLPAGIVLMWVWMKWPMWLKVLITVIPFLFSFLIVGFVFWLLTLIFSNKDVQKQMREQMQQQNMKISQMPSKIEKDWLLYKNPYFQYTLAYPNTWTLVERSEGCGAVLFPPNQMKLHQYWLTICGGVNNVEKEKNRLLQNTKDQIIKETTIDINNLPRKMIVWKEEYGSIRTEIYIEKENNPFIIFLYNKTPKDYQETNDIFDPILTTLEVN